MSSMLDSVTVKVLSYAYIAESLEPPDGLGAR